MGGTLVGFGWGRPDPSSAPPVYSKCYKRPKRGIETKHFAKFWRMSGGRSLTFPYFFSHTGVKLYQFSKDLKGGQICCIYYSDRHMVSTLPGGVWAYFGKGSECTAFFFGYHVCYIVIFPWYGFESYLCSQWDVNSLKLFEASDRRNGRLCTGRLCDRDRLFHFHHSLVPFGPWNRLWLLPNPGEND